MLLQPNPHRNGTKPRPQGKYYTTSKLLPPTANLASHACPTPFIACVSLMPYLCLISRNLLPLRYNGTAAVFIPHCNRASAHPPPLSPATCLMSLTSPSSQDPLLAFFFSKKTTPLNFFSSLVDLLFNLTLPPSSSQLIVTLIHFIFLMSLKFSHCFSHRSHGCFLVYSLMWAHSWAHITLSQSKHCSYAFVYIYACAISSSGSWGIGAWEHQSVGGVWRYIWLM